MRQFSPLNLKRKYCPGGSVVKTCVPMQETWVRFLGQKDPLEKETHTSILAWGILWTEEPGTLLSMGHKESNTT